MHGTFLHQLLVIGDGKGQTVPTVRAPHSLHQSLFTAKQSCT